MNTATEQYEIGDFAFNCEYMPQDTVVFDIGTTGVLIMADDGDSGESVTVKITAEQANALADAIKAKLGAANKPEPVRAKGYSSLTPLAQKIVQHIRRAGSISAREAMSDHGITSASLARRICDIEQAGFKVVRDRRVHPITGQKYTRYSIKEEA